MNERIRELARQSGLIQYDSDGKASEVERFAELFIMECITICEELGDRGMDGHYCADEINKTFRGA